MKPFVALTFGVCLVLFAGAALAKSLPLQVSQTPGSAQTRDAWPALLPGAFTRADTMNFGYYQVIGGQTYAVLGEKWTFDHGTPSLEGWSTADVTDNGGDFFRQITAASWAGHGNTVAAPVITDAGSVWLGRFEDEARTRCWPGGLGYGNTWCQRLTSPTYHYNGAGNVDIAFAYFQDSENGFDQTKVFVVAGPSFVRKTLLNGPGGFTGQIGTPPAGPWASYYRSILRGELYPGPTFFKIVIEFTSDLGTSDEDGSATAYGPFGMDDFSIFGSVDSTHAYTFDTGLEGWTAESCPARGTYMAVHPLSLYSDIVFPSECTLSGSILGFHDPVFQHPEGSHEAASSPPADLASYNDYFTIMADWDQYSDLPLAPGVFYRPGWSYYPYLCPTTGQTMWSPRMGGPAFVYSGDTPSCARLRDVATDWGVPPNCEAVKFVYEVISSCDAFGFPPEDCTGSSTSNASPLIDNIQIRVTPMPRACCALNGTCTIAVQSDCAAPGVWHPELASCSPNLCPPVDKTICEVVAVDPTTRVPYLLGAYVRCGGVALCASNTWQTSNIEFQITDGECCVSVFKANATTPLVHQGDQALVVGTVGQFNGKEEIDVSEITILSTGNELPTPGPVTTHDLAVNGENYENCLIETRCVHITSGTWPLAGFNGSVQIDDGTGPTILWIDRETDIDGSPQPAGIFTVVGIATQFDFAPPYSDYYEIEPRGLSDLQGCTGACCNPITGVCTVVTQAGCTGPSVWYIEWATCSPNPCSQPPQGVCCDPAGSPCTLTSEAACQSPKVWHGDWTTCSPDMCPTSGLSLLAPGGGEGLVGAAPNPFSASTSLWYRLAEPAHVRLTVLDAAGHRIRMLDAGIMGAGANSLAWDGRGSGGKPVAPGVYFARLTANGRSWTRTLIRIR